MASDYGLNFGFRRSDESMRSGTEGRLKVPATGTFHQGDLVTFDPAAPGFIKLADAKAGIDPGFTGLLVQEEAWNIPVHANQVLSTQDLDVVYNNRLCAIWTGAGLKIWLRNTAATTNPGQRARAAVTKVTATGAGIGDLLGWDGAKYAVTIVAAEAVGKITITNGVDYVEAVLAK